jgi:hypothetical protein
MTPKELQQLKTHWGFYQIRELGDGTVIGLGPLLFTTAVYVDVEQRGWGHRYCFENPDHAVREYHRLQSGDEEPVGYLARR